MRSEINVKEFSQIVREFASYKTAIQGCSQRTVEEYLLDLRTFFRYLLADGDQNLLSDPEAFAKLPIHTVDLDYLRNITTDQIYDFLLYTDTDRENKTAAKARKLSAIKGLYKFLINKRGLLTDNPAANIDSPKKKKALPKFLTLEESVTLLNIIAADTESKNRERDYCIVTLFLNCGMRLSELVGISLPDIDPQFRSLRVLGKGNKERIIYLNDACRNALSQYLKVRLSEEYRKSRDKALFFSNRMQRMSVKTVQAMVYKYLTAAGLGARKLSVHKLRHTAATLMYQSGEVDIRVLKDILGHEQLNTTQIYTHVSDRNMEEAMKHNPLAGASLPTVDRGDTEEDE
ncbi:MAG: tyrosine-type recombinase/integrase [Clostridia bacterium]|nr:tyrosine-type recombinase/integrase [Clostridia bacterium]